MANQTIGVSLKFSADVSAAKKAMTELQSSLAQINNLSLNSTGMGSKYAVDLNKASQAAAQLRIQLQSAFNPDTGKLNLAKFNQEMKNSGMSIAKYKAELSSIGPQGQQAFNKLAYSISTANTNTLTLSNGVRRLGTTFMNTFRYQLSSSIIMGFVSGIKDAVNYVKDLNSSLNNIRIVTGYGVKEMKQFANEANKVAKSLSTTTKAMTDAALIYFQQGLNMQEAQKRAETTIKLANVTGQAVEEVSNNLTAIWNNFYDGTQSLEYYADVITALGAATASSSQEISQGLEKFAAVAETVGLSYEYATSALATVTATTRQSADVVGTAFKTLFARIQDLELGNSLDDGVTLGQYSKGLAAVGVQVLDTSGGLREMDDILNDLGSKWQYLTQAQQVSLAQTVAGVRQYTQLIALMDNWSYFQENLFVAQSAEGELEKQQAIYAESWEAASDRVKAALETIYDRLLDDEGFINILDGFTELLDVIDKMISGLGGLPGILSVVGLALSRAFAPNIIAGANNLAASFMSMTKGGRAKLANMQAEANAAIEGSTTAPGIQGAENKSWADRAAVRRAYNANAAKMTPEARQTAESRMAAFEAKSDKYFNSDDIQNRRAQVAEADKMRRSAMISAKTAPEDEIKKALQEASRAKAEKGGGKGAWFLSKEEKAAIIAETNEKYGQENPQQAQALQNSANQMRQSAAAGQINTQLDIRTEETLAPLAGRTPGMEGTMDSAAIAAHGKSLEELESRMRSLGIEGGQLSERLKSIVGPDLEEDYIKYGQKIQDVKNALDQLKQAEASGDQGAIDAAQLKYDEELNSLNELNIALDKHTTDMQEAAAAEMKAAGASGEFVRSETAAGVAVGQTEVETSNLNREMQGLVDGMNKAGNATMTFGQKVQAGAQLAMSLSMAINSIKGVIDTWNNQDMTFGEKLLGTFTSLAMVLPMLISSFQSLNLVQGLNNLGLKMANKEHTKSVGLKGLLAKFTKKHRTEIEKESAADLKDAAANKIREKTERDLNNSKGKGQGTGQSTGGTPPKTPKGNGTQGLTSGGKAALGAVAGYVAAIAIVVATVVAIVKIAQAELNKEAKAAENAKLAAQTAKEAYAQAQEEYNALVENVSAYEEGVKGLEKLTKGTKEFAEAIATANEQAVDLISKYGELSTEWHIGDSGLIEFEEGALERVKEAEAQQVAKMQANATLAQNRAKELQLQADSVAFQRDELHSLGGVGAGVGNTVATAAMGAAAGAAAGSVVPVIGTAIGAIVGGIAGLVGGAIASSVEGAASGSEQDALNKIAEEYEKTGAAIFATPQEFEKVLREDLQLDDEALIKSLVDNTDAVKDLTIRIVQQESGNAAAWENAWIQANQNEAEKSNRSATNAGDIAAKAKIARGLSENESNQDTSVDNMSNKELARTYLVEVLGENESDIVEADGKWIGKHYAVGDTGRNGFTLYTIDDKGTLTMSGAKNQHSIAEARESVRTGRTLDSISADKVNHEYLEKMSILARQGLNDTEKNDRDLMNKLVGAQATGESASLSYEEYQKLQTKDFTNTEFNDVVNKSIESFKARMPSAIQSTVFEGWYEGLTKAEQELLWTINLDKDASFANIIDVWESAKAHMERDTITLQVNALDKLLDWNKFESPEDWNEYYKLIAESGITEEGEVDESGNLTHAAKVKYSGLSKAEIEEMAGSGVKQAGDSYGIAIVQSKEEAQEDIEANKKELEKANAELKDVEDRLGAHNAEYGAQRIQNYVTNKQSVVSNQGNVQDQMQENLYWLGSLIDPDEHSKLIDYTSSLGEEGEFNQGFVEALLASVGKSLNNIEGEVGSEEWITNLNDELEATDTFFIDQLSTNREFWNSLDNYYGYTQQQQLLGEKNTAEAKVSEISTQLTNSEDQLLTAAQDEQEWWSNFNNLNERYDLNTDSIDQTIKSYTTLAKTGAKVNKELLQNEFALNKVAQTNVRVNKGLDDLSKGWATWKQALAEGREGTPEFAEALNSASLAMANMFNVDTSAISLNFLAQHQEDIDAAVQGDEAAIARLREKLAEEILKVNILDFTPELQSLSSQITTFADNTDLKIGTTLTGTDQFLQDCQLLMDTGKMTKEAVSNYLNSLGYTIEWAGDKLHSATYIGDVSSIYNTQDQKDEAESKKQQKKKLDEERERYHEINEELKDIQRNLDNINKSKERAFGSGKLAYLKQEKKATEQLIEAQGRYIDEISANLKTDATTMASHGAKFDPATGRITNYDEMYEAEVARYNSAVDAKNAGNLTDAQFEKYQKDYEQFTKDLKQYEETLSLLEKETDQQIQNQRDLFDQELETIEIEVEINTEAAERTLKALEYQINNIRDTWSDVGSLFAAYESGLGDLYQKETDAELSKLISHQQGARDILSQTIKDPAQLDSILADPSKLQQYLEENPNAYTAEQMENLEGHLDGMIDSEKNLKAIKDTIQNDVTQAFEDLNSEMGEGLQIIEHMREVSDGYRNIVDLMGKENMGVSYAMLNKMNQQNVENARRSLVASKDILDANLQAQADVQEKVKNAQAKYDAAIAAGKEEEAKGLKKDLDYWLDVSDTIAEEIRNSEADYMSRWQDALQAAADAYADTVMSVMEVFEDAMSGFAGSFDALQEKWDQAQTTNERYLDDYEKIYNLSKLTRDINKSIDETDSVAAKQELKALQEEIYNLQESGAQVSQYEIDALKARYDLRVAEIALEEAQNAKSQVRMQRNADGNWGYVYTADESKVDEAEQNVEDKLFAYQQLTQERIDEMQEQLVGLPQEYSDAMAAIANDLTLTEEERKIRMNDLTAFYQEQYTYLTDQLGLAIDDSNSLYENEWQKYSETTGYKMSAAAQWVDTFKEATIQEITGYATLEDMQGMFLIATNTTLDSINKAYNAYGTNVQQTMEAIGIKIESTGSTIRVAMDPTGDAVLNLETTIANLSKAMEQVPGYVAPMVEDVKEAKQEFDWAAAATDTYSGKVKNAKDPTDNTAKSISDLSGNLDTLKSSSDTADGSLLGMTGTLGGVKTPADEAAGSIAGVKGAASDLNKQSLTSFGTNADTQIGKAEKAAEDAAKDVRDLKQAGKDGFKGLVDKAEAYQSKYNTEVRPYLRKNEELVGSYTDIINEFAKLPEEIAVNTDPATEALLALTGQLSLLVDELNKLNNMTVSPTIDLSLGSTGTGTYTKDQIKMAQNYVGTTADGNWGSKSEAAAKAKGLTLDTAVIKAQAFKEASIAWSREINAATAIVYQNYIGGQLSGAAKTVDLKNTIFRSIDNKTFMVYDEYLKPLGYVFSANTVKTGTNRVGGGAVASAYDTGGYTGEWDSSGRLALLHQKEIVLNAHDTENFLAAVNIVREIASAIDLQAIGYSHALAQLAHAQTAITTTQALEQEVTIHAEFPNATQRSEIEAAFDTLLNRASQFANRKN